MNLELFGLTKSPFTALPTGSDVFIGPQTANFMQSLESALAAPDAIVTVAGAAGIGKSTLVHHTLNAIAKKKKVVSLNRDSLVANNLLEMLLIELGVKNRPPETKRRVGIIRSALKQYRSAGHSVFIVVEDICETGAAVLADLASVTATGSEDSGGARLVLMGKDDLKKTLDDSRLSRLRKRIAHSHKIEPLSDDDTRAYLAHCFGAAGGDFDQIFETGSTELTCKLCDGNTLAINRLIDAVLCAAVEKGVKPITTHFINEIAASIKEQESAEELGKANLQENLDDAMAETLFGPEIDLFAVPTPRKG